MQPKTDVLTRDAHDLASLSAGELVKGFVAGSFTPVDVAGAVLRRMDALDRHVRAIVSVKPELTMAAAEASARRYRSGEALSELDGVPFGVKDIISTADLPTGMGSRAHFDEPWLREDAPVVARLKEAGAVLLAKTATPELSVGGVCDTHLASTRNPWDVSRTSGGSSGGPAVAAALGFGPVQIGTDSGGSIRIPAAFCGVVGLKATHQRVPDWPWSGQTPLLHVGPLARTVGDVARTLEIIARTDPRAPDRLPAMHSLDAASLEGGVQGWRVGVIAPPPNRPTDPEVQRLVDAAVDVLTAEGAICEAVAIDLGQITEILLPLADAGLAALIDRLPPEEHARLSAPALDVVRRRNGLRLADYVLAMEAREAFASRINTNFEQFDILISPTLPITAFSGGHPAPQDGVYGGAGRGEWTPYTYAFNLSRHPAVTCPIGLCADGLPAGLQIVGPLYREDVVLRAARAVERGLGWDALPPLLS